MVNTCGKDSNANNDTPAGGGRSHSPISSALSANAGAFLTLGAISGIINILMLTGSIYMIQIYDRVLIS